MTEIPYPNDSNNPVSQFEAFIELVKILRNECPWDKKQTNESIAHLMIEEAYEVIDSIHNNDDYNFSKELGDLLLHIVMHSIIAEQRDAFNLTDVISRIHKKMVDRHPHVFSEVEVKDENEVTKNWELLKKKEGKKSALEGVPLSLPSLLRAERIQHKASKVGFDWDKKEDAWEKVFEEIDEFKQELCSGNKERIDEEFGDLLFSLVNVARFEHIVPEESLQKANNKFISRFTAVESMAKNQNMNLEDMNLDEMDKLWNEAKK